MKLVACNRTAGIRFLVVKNAPPKKKQKKKQRIVLTKIIKDCQRKIQNSATRSVPEHGSVSSESPSNHLLAMQLWMCIFIPKQKS